MSKQDTELKEQNEAPQQPELIQETYVDGLASISTRQNVAKLDFYQALAVIDEDPSNQKEFRKVSHRLSLPTSSLVDIYETLDKIIKERNKAE